MCSAENGLVARADRRDPNHLRLADAFLSRITEDETGIWELDDEARSQSPELSAGDRFAASREALTLLVTAGLVQAWRSPPFAATGDPLTTQAALALIGRADSWISPSDAEGSTLTVMLMATESGLDFYFGGRKLAG